MYPRTILVYDMEHVKYEGMHLTEPSETFEMRETMLHLIWWLC
jgi:hypothetical protein